MEKRTLAVVAALVGVVVAVAGGSFVTVGADDAPRMEFDDGNITVSDASGEEVTVIEMSENGTGSYVVERRASEGVGITVREADDTRNASNGTEGYHVVYSIEEVDEDTVRVEAEEMDVESIERSNESNETFEIEVEGGENGTQEDG